MPLDPFFSERLRVHRRYLIGQRIGALRRTLRTWWQKLPRATAPADPGTAGEASARARTRETPRGRHRRAALAWDRKELATVGVAGPDVPTVEHRVEVAGFPEVRVRIYYPGARAEGDPLVPAWLTFFGGAFRIGGIDYPTTDAANRRRAADAGVAIVAVDYALAPEHRFPTQIEQGYAVLEWLHREAERLGLDRERLGVAGTSAGGSIAAAVTIANRERGRVPLRLQVLEVPVADLTGKHIDLRATRALGIPSLLAVRELRSVARTYLARPRDARDPLASPLLAASHADLPEALIFTAEYDPLRGDGAAYAARLRASGVEASAVQYLGVTHDVAIFGGVLPAARRWHRDIVASLARLHEPVGERGR